MTLNLSKAALSALLLVALAGCRDPGGVQTQPAPGRKDESATRFEHDGRTYAVARGDLYELDGSGNRKRVDRLYDPAFKSEQYVRSERGLMQVDPDSGTRYPVVRRFEEGFEGVSTVDDLMGESRWHRYNTDEKRTDESHNFHHLGNRLSLSRDIVHSGRTALKFHALPSKTQVSKASIAKGLFYFEKGDDFWFSGWFYLEDTPSITDAGAFTLMDMESSFVKYAGIRVIFRRNDSLAFELKFPKRQFEQPRGEEVPFPTGRWVHVKTHVYLSDSDGLVEIWQDGRQVLSAEGRTLPLEDAVYDRLELGITVIAKGSRYDKTLYVDDVAVSDAPL